MELAELVDQYITTRAQRLLAAKEVEKQEASEHTLKAQLIQAMKDAKASSIGGKIGSVRLKIDNEPTVGNWDKYYAHIRATGEFELLYRRINPKSIKERKDLGVDVPGIDWIPVEKLSISQV